MSMSYQIRQLLALKFFPKKVLSSWETAKLAFFCCHRVTKTHQDKIPFRIQINVAEWINLSFFRKMRSISPVA